MAKKLKIKIKVNNFYIPIPAIPLSLVSRILKFIYKHSLDHSRKMAGLNKISNQICPDEIEHIINTLKNTEPFELVNVDVEDQDSKVFVKIYTK
mgnify:CR=1 FL=1